MTAIAELVRLYEMKMEAQRRELEKLNSWQEAETWQHH